ncbi:MAG TPA: polyprenyl synthetase family protein, partial [Verrucomicrobiae bacterium]|nr:polyprenyl synthetase family protein [Verrucomicrobiae bacterium]
MDLQKYLKEKTELIDGALNSWLPQEESEPKLIHRAMRYSTFAGGKRIRPALVLAAAEAVGGAQEQVIPAACALEMIHTYSLIHDDLPAMDDDDFRRGRPSNHKMFGEGIAILAGDALLTYAFELLATRLPEAGVHPGIMGAVIREIAGAAGTVGMIGGQVLDLAAEGQKVDLNGLEQIHRWKTGALLKASVRVGAIIGG